MKLRGFYTLQVSDVGARTIRAWNKVWVVSSFIGSVLPRDVGKRVYHVGEGVLQVENDEQLECRRQHELRVQMLESIGPHGRQGASQ